MKKSKTIKMTKALIAKLNKERKKFKPTPTFHAYVIFKLEK